MSQSLGLRRFLGFRLTGKQCIKSKHLIFKTLINTKFFFPPFVGVQTEDPQQSPTHKTRSKSVDEIPSPSLSFKKLDFEATIEEKLELENAMNHVCKNCGIKIATQ